MTLLARVYKLCAGSFQFEHLTGRPGPQREVCSAETKI
jgi:hypothetical protein